MWVSANLVENSCGAASVTSQPSRDRSWSQWYFMTANTVPARKPLWL